MIFDFTIRLHMPKVNDLMEAQELVDRTLAMNSAIQSHRTLEMDRVKFEEPFALSVDPIYLDGDRCVFPILERGSVFAYMPDWESARELTRKLNLEALTQWRNLYGPDAA